MRNKYKLAVPVLLWVASSMWQPQITHACDSAPQDSTAAKQLGSEDPFITRASEATDIVVGEVVSKRSYWAPDSSVILTDYTILVSDHVKGHGSDQIIVTEEGGTVGDWTLEVSDSYSLSVGGQYALLLLREVDHVRVMYGSIGVRQIERLDSDETHFLSQLKQLFSVAAERKDK